MTETDFDLGGGSDDPFAEIPGDPAVAAEPHPVEPGDPGSPTNPLDLSDAPEEERLGGTDAEDADAEGAGDVGDASSSDPDPFGELSSEDDEAHEEQVAERVPEDIEGAEEPEPEPKPEPEPPKASAEESSPKRTYFIIEVLDDETYKKRAEVQAYNGDAALRHGFQQIATKPGAMKLLAVAKSNWRVRTVEGRPAAGMTVSLD